jgi:hypothetical protein
VQAITRIQEMAMSQGHRLRGLVTASNRLRKLTQKNV